MPPRPPAPASRSGRPRTATSRTATSRTATPRAATSRTAAARSGPPRTPQELARARARARAAAVRARAEQEARRRAAFRARLLAALTRWTHRAGAVGGALVVLLVAAVVVSGVQPATPASASAPLDLAAAATAARAELAATTTDLQDARTAVDTATAALAAAQDEAATTRAALDASREAVGATATDLYRGTPTDRVVAAGYPVTADPAAATSLAVLAGRVDQQLAGRTAAADTARQAADLAADRLATAETVLAAARDRVTAVTADARERAAALDPAVTAAVAGLAAAPSSPAQQPVDAVARTAWQTRLSALAAAGIVLPTARQLLDGDLPEGLTPAAAPGTALGVVDGAVVEVPSAEAAVAVSVALAQLGTPYTAGGTTPAGLDCTGLTASAWTAAGTAVGAGLADQWSAGSLVPAGELRAGDLVFGVDPALGLDDVGVYVGAGQVVTASATSFQVVVAALPEGAAGIRVTVPDAGHATPPGTGTVPATCGVAPVSVSAGPVDPAWGGWSNGRIPGSALCAVAPGQLLRCDAAGSYAALSRAYEQAFGAPLCITDSYRSYTAQQDAHQRKPRITAIPGTSNHGWGLAVDLCGGVNGFGTPQHTWMTRYAASFGWVHPDWAQVGGVNPEPWHWEFGLLAG